MSRLLRNAEGKALRGPDGRLLRTDVLAAEVGLLPEPYERKTALPDVEWKARPVDAGVLSRTTALALFGPLGDGQVDRIFNVTGVEDLVGDITVPGCYADTLRSVRPKVAQDHDRTRRVGKVLGAIELLPGDPRLPKRTRTGAPWPREAGVLAGRVQFMLNTQRGREAYEEELFYGDEAEWSIGYSLPPGGHRPDSKGRRLLLTMTLWEVSQVMWGASPDTGDWEGFTLAAGKDLDQEIASMHREAVLL